MSGNLSLFASGNRPPDSLRLHDRNPGDGERRLASPESVSFCLDNDQEALMAAQKEGGDKKGGSAKKATAKKSSPKKGGSKKGK